MKNPVKAVAEDMSYGGNPSIWAYIGVSLWLGVMVCALLLVAGLIIAGVVAGLPYSLIPVGIFLAVVLFGVKTWHDSQPPKVRIK